MQELNRLPVADFKATAKSPVVLVLDNVRSLHNVGAVFRTADAFALEHIYLCGVTGQPPHREITKTALGSTESVAWTHTPTTLEAAQQLQAAGYQLVAVEIPQLGTKHSLNVSVAAGVVLWDVLSKLTVFQ
jgi:23S rRNA (guanosine2251-2'-O)-methyltransferase